MSVGNTVKDGSGDPWWLVVDSDGHLIIAGAAAHDAAASGSPLQIGGVYRSSDPAVANGDMASILIDAAGRVKIVGAGAEDAAVVGYPVLIGGRYDATPRTLDDGDAGAVALDAAGRTHVTGQAAEDAAVAGNPVLIGGRYDSTNRDLDNGDGGAIALDADARVLVNNAWYPYLESEATADDSDKTVTVAASYEYEIQSIYVDYTSTADAGNRQLEIQFRDGSDNVIARVVAGAVQAASLQRFYTFAPDVENMSAFVDTDKITNKIPKMVLPAGYDVRIFDNAAIAAAADDMTIRVFAIRRVV